MSFIIDMYYEINRLFLPENLVKLERYGADGTLLRVITIRKYGNIEIDGKYVGYVKPEFIYKYVSQYDIFVMEGDYVSNDDSVLPYDDIYISMPRHGEWTLHVEEGFGPWTLTEFIKAIVNTADIIAK
jgi:hypothetical protein